MSGFSSGLCKERFTEVQEVATKDGATVVTSIIMVMQEIRKNNLEWLGAETLPRTEGTCDSCVLPEKVQ